MRDNILITELPDGGAVVEMDGETEVYSKAEIYEMERDYEAAIASLLRKEAHTG